VSTDLLDQAHDTAFETPVFLAFPKIPRFKRNYIITEKIDGTNAAVGILENGTVYAQSRKRIITPEADNFGFAGWVKKHEEELRDLGPGLHFGEWWGLGIQRGYGLTERCFSLFNTSRWGDDGIGLPPCVDVVPILAQGNSNLDLDIDGALESLRTLGSAAALGFMKPEGIVVYHTASRSMYKILLENDDTPKGVQE
jgi:hypothetical protein